MDEIQRNISERISEFQKIENSLKGLVEEHRDNLKGNIGGNSINETPLSPPEKQEIMKFNTQNNTL